MKTCWQRKTRFALGLLGLLGWTAQAAWTLGQGDSTVEEPLTNALACAAAQVETTVSNVIHAIQQAEMDTRSKVDAAVSNAVRTARERMATVRTRGNAVVTVGGNAELKEGETADAVVAIGGNATVHGTVQDAVVAILGNADVSGTVGDAVVAVMGNVRLLPGAHVRGEVVAVGGRIHRSEDTEIGGEVQEVDLGALQLPPMPWLKAWFKECVLRARPLSLGVGWVWWVAGAFLLLYGLVALALPRPVEACAAQITSQPATTLLVGLLAKLLVPFVSLVLLATGIGLFALPFFWAAVWAAGVVGKVALLVYLGRQTTRHFATGAAGTLLALLLGWILITALYLVPVVGLLVFAITGIWALGAAVMATVSGSKREREPMPPTPTPRWPESAPPLASASAQPAVPPPPSPTLPPTVSAEGLTGVVLPGTALVGVPPLPREAHSAVASAPRPSAVLPEALALPRAGFWERMGAAFLDIILVSILGGLVGGPPWLFLVALAYFAGMWTWRGTTVGGVVLKLKVARLDGRPVTFAVALVRALAATFSVVVLFLGFFWIAWDADKQGWHDKIAGTVVVRLPRPQSLVCY